MTTAPPQTADLGRKASSLNSFLTLISLALFALLCLGSAVVNKRNFEAVFADGARERITLMAQTINFAFETMIDRNDFSSLQRVVENVGANPEVRRLTIVNRDLNILADKTITSERAQEQQRIRAEETDLMTAALQGVRQIREEHDADGTQLLTVAIPLRGGRYFPEFHSDIVGVIRLSYDLAPFHAAARRNTLSTIISQCIAFLAVILVLNVLARRFVLKPIRELAEASRRLAEGDLTASVIIRGQTEIGELGGAFNDMASHVAQLVHLREESAGAEARVSALQGVNVALEAEIKERRLTEQRLRESQDRLEEQRQTALTLAAEAEAGRRHAEQAETKFKLLLESAPDGMVIIDEDGSMILVNAQAEKLFGYPREEMLGQSIEMLIPERYRAAHPAQRRHYLANPAVRPMGAGRELLALHKDGHEIPVEVSLSPLRLRGIVLVLSTIRDISRRKQSEARLAVRREVTEILATAITAREVAARVLPVVCRATGWDFGAVWTPVSRDSVLRCVNVYHSPQLTPGPFIAMTRKMTLAAGVGLAGFVWQRGEPVWVADVGIEAKCPRAELAKNEGLQAAFGLPIMLGKEVLGVVEFFSAAIREPDPELLEMFAVIGSQIGQFMERKRAEEAELEAYKKYRAIFDNAVEGIYQTTVAGEILTVNPAMAQMLGYRNPKELMDAVEDVGRQLYVDPQRRQVYVDELAERGMISGFETQFRTKDGSSIWASLTARAIRDSAGEITHFEGTVENISPRKQVEEQLRQAQKMEAVGRLAGGVAHDFNNLLTVINGFTEIAIGQLPKDATQQSLLQEVLKAGERAAGLTYQLLAFSRKQVLEPKVLILSQLVVDAEKLLRRLIGEDVELRVMAVPDLWPVMADPGQMQQVIMNLAVNARDAMPGGGRLILETANVDVDADHAERHPEVAPGPFVRLAVTDTGCGMDAATRARIFEPFFTTKGPDKGTGLGLAVAYGIVKQSGGFIYVYSEPGHGTTFKIYLPRYVGSVTLTKIGRESSVLPRGTETILLVEDDDAVRELAAQVLKTCGYTVFQARNGEQGVQVAADQAAAVQLVITDVIMPTMNGKEMAERLVARHPGLKVLYSSGYTAEAITHHGVLAEGTTFLQKPYSPAALAQKVREVLDR